MTSQERDALMDLNDAIEDTYAAANALLASGRDALASDLHAAATLMASVRDKLRR